jgi:hypothetical protein
VTTPEASDGLVDLRTVSEQLLYEIGDPGRYLLPDVTCDWRRVTLEQVGSNRVAVAGARGWAPPPSLKGCAQIEDGWRVQFLLFIGGRAAVAKARRVAAELLERGRRMLQAAGFDDFTSTDVEVLGAEATYGPNSRATTREVLLKIAAAHASKEALDRFVREVPSIALAGPPGVSGGGAGLPQPTPLIRLQCFPVERESISVSVEVAGSAVRYDEGGQIPWSEPPAETLDYAAYHGPSVLMPLIAIAHGRSGDKGSDVNIGIRARHRDLYPTLLSELTEDRVGAYLAHLGSSSVHRYELPGIHAVNFLLVGGLGAGGTASLRFDPQGKAVAQQLLDLEIAVPAALVEHEAVLPI